MSFKIDYVEWIEKTALKMEQSEYSDIRSWNIFWEETYFKDLKGNSENTANKPCPRSAAYALWKTGQLICSKIKEIPLSIEGVIQAVSRISASDGELLKNATYAILGLLLAEQYEMEEDDIPDTDTIWPLVKSEFKKSTGKDPADSEQGAIELTLSLYEQRKFKRQKTIK